MVILKLFFLTNFLSFNPFPYLGEPTRMIYSPKTTTDTPSTWKYRNF